MKAAIVNHPGQTPVYGSFPEPQPQAGEQLVAVTAAALSPLTRARAAGTHYSVSGQFPFVAGIDGVGRLSDGRRVYFMLPRAPFGAMADLAVVPISQCIALPDDVDDVTAAAIANPGMSSWAALTERAQITPGASVLVNGATGASGRLAVRIARHLGAARVVATGRNAGILAAVGADATIVLGEDEERTGAEFREQFAAGVDIVLDYLWGPSARSLLIAGASSAAAGIPIVFVQIGSASGAEIAMPAALLRSSPITMLGSGLGSVGLDRLLASVTSVMQAASVANLQLEHQPVALSQVESEWNAGGDGGRKVFVPDQADGFKHRMEE